MERKYSLIIIGAGITGLSAAIAWAKNVDISSQPVLVLEQHKLVGGMVTSFRRKGFLFDTAQLIPDPSILFRYLGIRLELKRFSNYFARIFIVKGDQTTVIPIPSGFIEFKDMLMERYPGERKAIERFFKCSATLFDELRYLRLEPSFFDLFKILIHCPVIVRHSRKTFREYYQSFGFKDPECQELFDVFAAFSGLPAERAAAMMTVAAMNTSLIDCYRPVKGFIQLPVSLKKRAEELGCTIRTRTRVSRILVEDGKARGVLLDNGKTVMADHIITTIDPKVAMGKLVGLDILKKLDSRYATRVEQVKMSSSAVTVSLGLDDRIDLGNNGLDCGYNVITTGGDTFERLFKAFDRGTYLLDENMFHCAVICPSLTTGGKPVVVIRIVPMPMSEWKVLREEDYKSYTSLKEKIADFYIDKVEKYLIPDLKKHILYRDIATPATYERFTGTPSGSNYDMAPYPENFGLKRLKMRTPVKGLYQPKFSHGIWPSVQGGLQAVDMILGGKIMKGYSRYRE